MLALLDGPLHGYGIIVRVEEWTGGRVRLPTATLYTALGRLQEAGLIEELAEEGVDARRGRSYRLTAAGRELVRTETRRLEGLVALSALAHGRGGGSGGPVGGSGGAGSGGGAA
jgi:DNA-binding PadR family transcriptional regulator